MHGQFNYWHFARGAVERAAHDGVGLVYNCDVRDIVGGSIGLNVDDPRIHAHDYTLFRAMIPLAGPEDE